MQLIFEKFTPEDFESYYQLVGDLQVMAMITERSTPPEEARRDYETLLSKNALDPDCGQFKILDASNRQFLGLAKLEVEAADSDEAEVGYMILPQYWGQGIGGAVADWLVERANAHVGLHRLFAIIDPANVPSKKILLRRGFESVEFRDFDGLPGEILEFRLR
ncbi:GNAT family N-acetyltransferase [Stenotrophomonas maltophilia]|nr:GNAT family N-acetyltransferase [Stenotrophomonas maltophilia]